MVLTGQWQAPALLLGLLCCAASSEGNIVTDGMDSSAGLAESNTEPHGGATNIASDASLVSYLDGDSSPESLGASTLGHRLCQVTEGEYQGMPLCDGGNIAKWRTEGQVLTNGTGPCHFDEVQQKIICHYSDECSGFEEVKDEVRGVTEVYDCSECDNRDWLFRKKASMMRISCCNVCKQRKQATGSVVNGVRINMVICRSCEEEKLRQIVEDHKDVCEMNSKGEFKCKNTGKTCKVGSKLVDDQRTLCHVTPCDKCPDGTLARAQCCAQCLEQTCSTGDLSSETKQVCTGCGDVKFSDSGAGMFGGSSGDYTFLWVLALLFLLAIGGVAAAMFLLKEQRGGAYPGFMGGSGTDRPGVPRPSPGPAVPPPHSMPMAGAAPPPSMTGGPYMARQGDFGCPAPVPYQGGYG